MHMHTALFDTLHYATKLEQAGVPRNQAIAQAEALAEIVDERLATKDDLKNIETSLKHEFQTKLLETKNDLIKWVLSAGITQAAIVISYLKLIH